MSSADSIDQYEKDLENYSAATRLLNRVTDSWLAARERLMDSGIRAKKLNELDIALMDRAA